MQNWNDGKLQEYANRTEYEIDSSALKKPVENAAALCRAGGEEKAAAEQKTAREQRAAREQKAAIVQKTAMAQPENIRYLFTTKTCPNCRVAKEYLKDVSYVTVAAEDNPELAGRYGVMQAPTLVVVDGERQQKYVNASNIKRYADGMGEVLSAMSAGTGR